MEHEIPTLFTSNPKEIINAIEKNEFDYKKFSKFVNKNVKVPKSGCLNGIINLIRDILARKE